MVLALQKDCVVIRAGSSRHTASAGRGLTSMQTVLSVYNIRQTVTTAEVLSLKCFVFVGNLALQAREKIYIEQAATSLCQPANDSRVSSAANAQIARRAHSALRPSI